METTVSSRLILDKAELNKISEDQLRFSLNLQLVDILSRSGVIKYLQPEPDLFGKVEVKAEIKVIIDTENA